MKDEKFRVGIHRQEVTPLCGECNRVMRLRHAAPGRNPHFECGNCRLEVSINQGA